MITHDLITIAELLLVGTINIGLLHLVRYIWYAR
jgi:hypothetical protein